MNIMVFGKKLCSACEETKKEFSLVMQESKYKEKLNISFLDMDSIDGLTEGALNDVAMVPTTIFKQGDEILARWEGVVPPKAEYQSYLEKNLNA